MPKPKLLKPTKGMCRHPLYMTWAGMMHRCSNPKVRAYAYYGRRGIAVCERWRDFTNFIADMGERPPGTSLDRIDGNGNYEPGNCRWATPYEQANNRRLNYIVSANGESLTLGQWADRTGISHTTLWSRIKRGWSIDEAVTLERLPPWSKRRTKKPQPWFGPIIHKHLDEINS